MVDYVEDEDLKKKIGKRLQVKMQKSSGNNEINK